MARVDGLEVPVDFATAWRVIFGTGMILIHPGSTHVEADELVRTRAPEHREPPNIPTAEQLAVRAAFDAAAQNIDEAPYRERHGYWTLAQGTGMHSMHYFRHLQIPPIYRGASRQSLQRPQTSVYKNTYATGWAQMVMWDLPDTEQTVEWDITADPGTQLAPPPGLPTNQVIVFEAYLYDEPPYQWQYNILLAATPTARTTYHGTEVLPARPGVYSREVDAQKFTTEQNLAWVLWRLRSTATPGGIDGYNMDPATMTNE